MVRALRVPGELQSLPGSKMRVKVAFQFFYLAANTLDFHRGLSGGGREPAQFRHIALESVDLRLPFAGNCVFICNRGGIQFIARLRRFGRGKLLGLGPGVFAIWLARACVAAVPELPGACSLHHRDRVSAADFAHALQQFSIGLHSASRFHGGFRAVGVHQVERHAATSRPA